GPGVELNFGGDNPRKIDIRLMPENTLEYLDNMRRLATIIGGPSLRSQLQEPTDTTLLLLDIVRGNGRREIIPQAIPVYQASMVTSCNTLVCLTGVDAVQTPKLPHVNPHPETIAATRLFADFVQSLRLPVQIVHSVFNARDSAPIVLSTSLKVVGRDLKQLAAGFGPNFADWEEVPSQTQQILRGAR